MSLEKDIERIDRLIEQFKKVREEYPRASQYKRIIFQLEDERAELADTIGRNHEQNRSNRRV